LAEGENPHPANYQGCRHAKEEMQKKTSQRTDIQDYNGKGVPFQPHYSRPVLRAATPREDRGTAAPSDTSGGSDRSRQNGTQDPCGFAKYEHQTTGQSVRAPNVNSLPLEKNVESSSNGSIADYDSV
jgi:hypothetical protein